MFGPSNLHSNKHGFLSFQKNPILHLSLPGYLIMNYSSLESCLTDLEKNGQLIRITEEVDPDLEMAAIHLRVQEKKGPALLFENVRGSRFRAASNIFGTPERCRFLFRNSIQTVKRLIELKKDPAAALRQPFRNLAAGWAATKAVPWKDPLSKPVLYETLPIHALPQIRHWPMDGGAFVTLPQVYSENCNAPGIRQANLGMYRVQLSGNQYEPDQEIGLHYQLNRGIGIHQTLANAKGLPLKVSVFVGGPPAHTLAAVMPLPEGISELAFAGILGGRRFRYCYQEGFCISTDADFVITGTVYPGETKPEGPFGDHLGYYSLQHPFPLLRVAKVYAKKNAIWPFTVVGRPPQEDSSFGELIHELTGTAIQEEIPGLREINAVDAAGVHPLLLAIGSERYTPYLRTAQPSELLTIASHILGTGQLSLAKFLWITAGPEQDLSTRNIPAFLQYVLERIDFSRDLHFFTNTTIDTLDYSGTVLNSGSKLVLAAYGAQKWKLSTELPEVFKAGSKLRNPRLILPGILAAEVSGFQSYEQAAVEMDALSAWLLSCQPALDGIRLIVLGEDADFIAADLQNFLWVTFTRSNPAADIYGVGAFTQNKHWGCSGPLIIDARIKPHHAPPVEKDPETERNIERIFNRGGSLYQKLT